MDRVWVEKRKAELVKSIEEMVTNIRRMEGAIALCNEQLEAMAAEEAVQAEPQPKE